MRHLEEAVAAGDHSVDVGCMQVNTKWHMGGFHELADMLDPVQNADYAAGFLLDLHEAHQSWDDAVKHYHSAEPEKHMVYHRRVLAELEMFLNGRDDETEVASGLPEAGDSAVNLSRPSTGPLQDDRAADLALRAPLAPAALPAMPPEVSPTAGPVSGSTTGSTAVQTSAPKAGPVTRSTTGSTAGMGAMDKQPNLAPHWKRVEHFRRLLAEGAG